MTMVVVSLDKQCLGECGDLGKIWKVFGNCLREVISTCFDPRKVEEHFTTFLFHDTGDQPSIQLQQLKQLLELDGRLHAVVRHRVEERDALDGRVGVSGETMEEKNSGCTTEVDLLSVAARHIQRHFFERDKTQTNFAMLALCERDGGREHQEDGSQEGL